MKTRRIKNLILGLSTILLINGCKSIDTEKSIKTVTPVYEEEQEETDYITLLTKHREACLKDYNYKLDRYDINYVIFPCFTDEEISLMESRINDKCDYEINKNSDYLVETIINNSKESDNSIFDTKYNDLVKSTIYEVLDNIPSDGYDDDYHLYENLKVVKDETIIIVSEYDHINNIVRINPNLMIDENHLINNLKIALNSIREFPCECIDKEYQGLSYDSRGSILNILASLKDTQGENIDSSIKYYYDGSKEIFLLSLLNDQTPDDFYNSIYNNDYDGLCNFFELESDEDKHIFYNIMSSEEMKLLSCYDHRFNNRYKLDLFKMYLENLVEYQSTNNASQDEILLLFDYGKYILLDDYMMYDTKEDFDFYVRFMDMEKDFKEYMADYYSTQITQINRRENELLDVYAIINNICYYGDDNVVCDQRLKDNALIFINKYPNLKLLLSYSYHNNLRYMSIQKDIANYYESKNTRLYEEEVPKIMMLT